MIYIMYIYILNIYIYKYTYILNKDTDRIIN